MLEWHGCKDQDIDLIMPTWRLRNPQDRDQRILDFSTSQEVVMYLPASAGDFYFERDKMRTAGYLVDTCASCRSMMALA